LLRVTATRIRPEEGDAPPRFVINFSGNPDVRDDLDSSRDVRVQTSEGKVQNLVLQTNEAVGGWQVFFDLDGAGDSRSQIQLRLQPGGRSISENWVYDYQKSN
jgi:glucan biosynthesis protein